jgi:type II secretion system protein J
MTATRDAKQPGFTLLEVLIAIAIVALLALIGYRAVAALSESESRLSTEATRWRTLDLFFARLEADLREAVPRTARNGSVREPAWLATVDPAGNGALEFSRAGPEFAIDPGSAGQRLGYRLRNGTVVVRVLVSRTGHPFNVSLLRGSMLGRPSDEAVVAAVTQWTFSPATKQGEPVNCWFHIGVPLGRAN